jgi:FtsP/CotA-like multicopper oxidase with cupredoxin domain
MNEINEFTLTRPPFPPDNLLVNGTGVKPNPPARPSPPAAPNAPSGVPSGNPPNGNEDSVPSLSERSGRPGSQQRGGEYFKIKIQKGKKYRLRLINTSVNAFFHVSLDGHPFQVITSDFIPIVPYTTDQLAITIGQRYDVIIDANQRSGNYWLRVNTVSDCGTNTILDIGKVAGAIVSYEDAPNPNALPTSTGVKLSNKCDDETNTVPWVRNVVPKDQYEAAAQEIDLKGTVTKQGMIQWLINGTAMRVDWGHPTLQTVLDGSDKFGQTANVIELPNKDQWYFWLIQEIGEFPLEHPIHLHGHDFYVLGSGVGMFNGRTEKLNFANPTRRDTATLPSNGYLVLGFPADNPGSWVMHCHIVSLPIS